MTFQEHFYQRMLALDSRDTVIFPENFLPDNFIPAAVLMLFWPTQDNRINIALTQRTDTLPTHQGQVSFPGGKQHSQDKNLVETALRETREELGINTDKIKIMGRLDDAWSSFGHVVVPYVGWAEQQPDFLPNLHEVSRVIIADIETLMLPDTATTHSFTRDGLSRITYAFSWDDGYVWGMTADILLELFLWLKGEDSNRGSVRLENMKQQLGVK